jgi:hypothetical protein
VNNPSAGDNIETDPRFPSGPWIGFFVQSFALPGKHWMELRLTFRAGAMTGEGRDYVGSFVLNGSYAVGDGRCYWTKTYLGLHDVLYSGFNEGKGIWGGWEIPAGPSSSMRLHGGFHIWPEGMPDPSGESLVEQADLPVEQGIEIAEPVAPVLRP